MKKSLRWISLLVIVVMLGSLFIGCSKDEKDKVDANKPDQEDGDKKGKDGDKEGDEKPKEGESGKITDKPVKLTYWETLNSNVAANHANLGDTKMAKEFQERTGVEIEYLHPPQGQAGEQFNLMIGTGELPDLIGYGWLSYPGGPGKAIDDDVIVGLNDLLDKHAPNFKKVLESDNLVDKMAKTDDGKYYMFPCIMGGERNMVSYGPVMRKDWLDDLNMKVPTTIDEWYDVLIAFRDQKNAPAPFLGNDITRMACAFDIVDGFYQEDGKIKYGPIEPSYKDYLETMNRWYKEGLIDPDYSALDGAARDAKITGGDTGAFFGWSGSGIQRYLTTMKDEDPKYDLTGVPYPAKEKGGKAFSGQREFPVINVGTAITTACKEIEIAAKWLDYGYSEEGHMLYNFGIEGESYEMKDGYPTYTELITNNPDGLPMNQAMSDYMRSAYSGPFVQDSRYHEQYMHLDQQKKALEYWVQADGSHRIPQLTPTFEESGELTEILNEVNTYVNEMRLKFIMGQEPLEQYDSFVENIKKLKIDRAIEIQNAALERFNNR